MSKIKYYDPRNIFGKNADFNLIVGQRSNGKTYALLKHCLELYKDKGVKFAYIRLISDNIKKSKAEQLFLPLPVEEIFGVGWYIKYNSGKYYLYDDTDTEIDIIGYILALSEVAKYKSVPFPDVKTIIYDEFIHMSGERVLFDEISAFENMLSTIIRTATDVKVYLLANTVSKHSPFFTHFGIDINRVKQGEIVVREYVWGNDKIGKVALEYCKYNEDVGTRASKYAMSKMINKGEWEIAEVDSIPSVNNERATEKLLFSMYVEEIDANVCCYVRTSKWYDLEVKDYLYVQTPHIRQFLVLRLSDSKKSHYYHLTNQKTLDYNNWNNLMLMMKDIEESTGIDFIRELNFGRVFCDNMFTADYFTHCWNLYSSTKIRDLL